MMGTRDILKEMEKYFDEKNTIVIDNIARAEASIKEKWSILNQDVNNTLRESDVALASRVKNYVGYQEMLSKSLENKAVATVTRNVDRVVEENRNIADTVTNTVDNTVNQVNSILDSFTKTLQTWLAGLQGQASSFINFLQTNFPLGNIDISSSLTLLSSSITVLTQLLTSYLPEFFKSVIEFVAIRPEDLVSGYKKALELLGGK